MKRFLISILILGLLALAVPTANAAQVPWRVIESTETGHNPTPGDPCGPQAYLQFSVGSARIDYCDGANFSQKSYAITASTDPQWCFDDSDGSDQTSDVCLKAVCTGTDTCDYYVTAMIGGVMTDVLFIDADLNGKVTPLRETCKTIVDLTDDGFDAYEIFMASQAITVLNFGCHCADGTCDTQLATLILEDRAGNDMTGTPTCSTGTDATTYTSITGGGLDAGEGLAIFQSASMTQQNNDYLICFSWVVAP